MTGFDIETWEAYAGATAFIGNTLLKPMTQTEAIGLDPKFWEEFPDFESNEVRLALSECASFARDLPQTEFRRTIERVSVEFTRLFVGPPSPAAPPWETMNRMGGITVGFGEATFEMRRLLREAGLKLCGENNQYEDHMGIELLYLSVICQRVSDALAAGDGVAAEELAIQATSFASAHPASWINALRERVEETFPGGYFSCILRLCQEVLRVLSVKLHPSTDGVI